MATTQNPESQPSRRADNTVADWPFKFVQHNFGARCFSTYECAVTYNRLRLTPGDESELRPALEEVHPDALRNASTGQIGIMNFPPPAQVRWRSKDGSQHEAEVDIGEIFKDQLILHDVPKDDIAEGISILNPDILLVVQDRTIEVYMRAFVPTKSLREPREPEQRLSKRPDAGVEQDLLAIHLSGKGERHGWRTTSGRGGNRPGHGRGTCDI